MHPDAGRIIFDGREITNTRPESICALGVARTWQVVRAFGRMTVLENVVCGALARTSRIAHARARAGELLEFTELRDRGDAPAGTLTLADKKRLEIARALATRPRLLLLDEAMSGLTPLETAAAVRLVRQDHAAQGHRGPGGAAGRPGVVRRARDRDGGCVGAREVGRGARARGPPPVQPAERRREPDPGQLQQRRSRPPARDARAHRGAFS